MTRLIEARDGDFGWMLGGEPSKPDLRLPPGGIGKPEAVHYIRDQAKAVYASHDRGAWLIVEGDEVVGLCGYKAAPDADGAVEIGYGIAESRRNLGHASRAVEAMVAEAVADPAVKVVLAVTEVNNPTSQRCLMRNGFAEIDRTVDPEEGPVILWLLTLA